MVFFFFFKEWHIIEAGEMAVFFPISQAWYSPKEQSNPF